MELNNSKKMTNFLKNKLIQTLNIGNE